MHGGVPLRPPRHLCIHPPQSLPSQYNTSTETVSFQLEGAPLPPALHVWVTQFGWQGNAQTNSSFFQQAADVEVVGGTVTVTVPVDAIITLSTIVTSECYP
jgi:hypothetical protein